MLSPVHSITCSKTQFIPHGQLKKTIDMVNHIIKFITILLITKNIYGKCNDYTAHQFLKRSLYDFNAGLVTRVNQETESHFVVSGLSAWAILSTLSFGAAEETFDEINTVLRLHPHVCFNRKYFNILKEIGKNDGGVLEHSGAMFIDSKINVYEQFKQDVQNTGVSEVNELPWDDDTATATAINDFVRSATHEAIDEIVTPSELDGVLLVLIDALYFKGNWRVLFPYENTESSPFYNTKGNQIGNVNLMYVTGTFNMTSVEQIGARVLELPYGDDNRYSMLLFLPYTSTTVSNVIDNLKRVPLSSIFTLFSKRTADEVIVQIPRFKIVSDINNLKELLTDMGLKTMFDSGRAKFSGISEYQIYVSNLIQKAHIEVTEEGTVAAAVSEVVFVARMLPDQFTANKPFLFMIVDRRMELALFTGAYSKPTEF